MAVVPISARRLGDDVGQQKAFDSKNLVLQNEFALLQALDLQLIEGGDLRDAGNNVIQVAVLALHLLQLDPQPFFFRFVQTHSAATRRQYKSFDR